MIRSAAKNYQSVTVVVDPADYGAVLETMRDHEGETTLKLRERLAIKAFIKTSSYDRAIGNYLNQEQATDASFSLSLPLVSRLRYGENPHQTAALYGDFEKHFKQLHGKELSYNNILDISAATNLIAEFSTKHLVSRNVVSLAGQVPQCHLYATNAACCTTLSAELFD